MKRIFGFGRKKKEQAPSGGASLPCRAGAYELRQKDLGKLHRAAAGGDLAQVRQGLKKYGIDGRDKAERTPLHLACASGHVDVVRYLAENKCQLNLFDSDNRSPLMKAVQCQREECVAVLLEHGADLNLADADGNTALHLAVLSANTSVLGLLVEHQANIHAQNKEGCTPLTLAVSEHHEEMVELLLKRGADVHARDECERTPLMTAASGGELNLTEGLLGYGADVCRKDTNGQTAEDCAVIHGYSSSAPLLQNFVPVGVPSLRRLVLVNNWQTTRMGRREEKLLQAIHKASQSLALLSGQELLAFCWAQLLWTEENNRSEDEGCDGSWPTSEEEELDFTPKKLQKPNLKLLMNASRQFRKNSKLFDDGDGSGIESPKSPKRSLKERTPSDANLKRGECGELLNQDVLDASKLEEEELEEEEEESDENDNGGDDDNDFEEEEEEDEGLPEAETEEEDLEGEETQSNDIVEEEHREQTEPGDVCDVDKISKELEEKVEEAVDTPVSFIAGCYERLQENVSAISAKIMNNKVSCKSVSRKAVFQNLSSLQGKQESWTRKSVIQEQFPRKADSCFADSEMREWKKEIPQPLSGSCGLKEKKSSFGDGFERSNNSWSAAKNPRLESQRPNSVPLGRGDDEDPEEQQHGEVDDKACEALEQESENLCLNRHEENLRAAFHSSTKEEACEWAEEEEEQKEDSSEELQTAVAEGVKSWICNDSHEVHNASKDNAGSTYTISALDDGRISSTS
ncbi:uncharacterized protein FYN16_009266 [Cariama cristata]